jgi:hypothetical protein
VGACETNVWRHHPNFKQLLLIEVVYPVFMRRIILQARGGELDLSDYHHEFIEKTCTAPNLHHIN